VVALAVSVQAGQRHPIHVPGVAVGGAVVVDTVPARTAHRDGGGAGAPRP
jgi:hypothetical protein